MSPLTPEELIQAYPEIDFLVSEGQVSSSYMVSIHRAFYQFATDQINGGAVLDAGCGTGFGTALLRNNSDLAVGVDIKDKLLQYAAQTYKRDGLYFVALDVGKIGAADESFEVVVANELLEHLPDHRTFLEETVRVLRPGGLFICATVNNTHTFGTDERPLNRNHFREYNAPGFKKELERYFKNVKLMGQGFSAGFQQYMQSGSARRIEWLLMKLNVKHRIPAAWRTMVRSWITGVRMDNTKPGEFAISDRNVENALYLVALAQKQERDTS